MLFILRVRIGAVSFVDTLKPQNNTPPSLPVQKVPFYGLVKLPFHGLRKLGNGKMTARFKTALRGVIWFSMRGFVRF